MSRESIEAMDSGLVEGSEGVRLSVRSDVDDEVTVTRLLFQAREERSSLISSRAEVSLFKNPVLTLITEGSRRSQP